MDPGEVVNQSPFAALADWFARHEDDLVHMLREGASDVEWTAVSFAKAIYVYVSFHGQDAPKPPGATAIVRNAAMTAFSQRTTTPARVRLLIEILRESDAAAEPSEDPTGVGRPTNTGPTRVVGS